MLVELERGAHMAHLCRHVEGILRHHHATSSWLLLPGVRLLRGPRHRAERPQLHGLPPGRFIEQTIQHGSLGNLRHMNGGDRFQPLHRVLRHADPGQVPARHAPGQARCLKTFQGGVDAPHDLPQTLGIGHCGSHQAPPGMEALVHRHDIRVVHRAKRLAAGIRMDLGFLVVLEIPHAVVGGDRGGQGARPAHEMGILVHQAPGTVLGDLRVEVHLVAGDRGIGLAVVPEIERLPGNELGIGLPVLPGDRGTDDARAREDHRHLVRHGLRHVPQVALARSLGDDAIEVLERIGGRDQRELQLRTGRGQRVPQPLHQHPVGSSHAAETGFLGLGLADVLLIPPVGVVVHADHLNAHPLAVEPAQPPRQIVHLRIVGNVEHGGGLPLWPSARHVNVDQHHQIDGASAVHKTAHPVQPHFIRLPRTRGGNVLGANHLPPAAVLHGIGAHLQHRETRQRPVGQGHVV